MLEKEKHTTRQQSTTNTLRLRVAAIEAGRAVRVPEHKVMLGVLNNITSLRTIYGQFQSDKQAVAFALAGVVLQEPIAIETLLGLKRVGGFFSLNDSQIHHLLDTRKVEMSHRYGNDTIMLWEDGDIAEQEPFIIDEIPVEPDAWEITVSD